METLGAIYDAVIKGRKVFDVLQSFVDNDIRMYAEKDDWSKTDNRVLFKADEKPIRSFFSQGFKDYHAEKGYMDKFKEIEIIFNNGDFYESFVSRYYNRNPVPQRDIINYLKFISQKFSSKYEISMVTTYLQKKTIWFADADSMESHQTAKQVMELKLTFTIN